MGDHVPHVGLHVGQAEAPVRHHLAGHVEGHVRHDGLGVGVLVLVEGPGHGEGLLHARDQARVGRDESHVTGREEVGRVTGKPTSVPKVSKRT